MCPQLSGHQGGKVTKLAQIGPHQRDHREGHWRYLGLATSVGTLKTWPLDNNRSWEVAQPGD